MPKIPGVEMVLGGAKYIVPPLALGELQNLQARLSKMSDDAALHPDSIATIVDAAHASLRRNYPDMTRETVSEMVDVGNMFDVITSVLDVTGIKRKTAEEAAKNQTAQPAQ